MHPSCSLPAWRGSVPSAELPLDLGSTAIAIQVSHPSGLLRTYRIVVNRAGKLAQSAYGKASNTDAFDGLGFSMAVWGDVLAVGAWSEDSAATGMDGNQDDNRLSDSGAICIFH